MPPPPRVGRKKKNKGIDAATKLPGGTVNFLYSNPNYKVSAKTAETGANQGLPADGGRDHQLPPKEVGRQGRGVKRRSEED
jgi:hypothetical protein